MLIGADPTHVGDRCIRVTIHHCFFDGTRQRHPRVRFGKVHLYNNYTRNWGIYAVCASVESQVNGYLFSLLIKCLKFSVSSIFSHIFLSDFFFFFFFWFNLYFSQIYSQCNIYEAGQKKKSFEYYTEKVKYILLCIA